MQIDAETCTQGCCEQSAACGGSHQCKGCQVYLYAPGTGTFVYHDVDAIVLHRTVEVLFHDRAQAVYLIDEEHIVGLKAGEDARQIAWLVEYRSAGELETYAQLVGYDVAQGGLSQSWRTMQERMVERLTAILGSLYEDAQVIHHLLLAAEVAEAERAECILKVLLARLTFPSDVEVFFHYSVSFLLYTLLYIATATLPVPVQHSRLPPSACAARASCP